MHRLRNYIFCVLVTIILFFSMTAMEGFIFIKASVLKSDTYIEVIDEKKVPEKLCDELTDHFEEKANATGIPKEVYEEVLEHPVVQDVMGNVVEGAFDYIKGKAKDVDYEEAKEKLAPLKDSIKKYLEDYADKNKVEKDEEFYNKTEKFADEESDYIIDSADVYKFSTVEKAGYLKYAKFVADHINELIAASSAAVGVFLIVLFLLNLKNKKNYLYWFSTALFIMSAAYLGICIYVKQTSYFDKFAIKAPPVFSAMTGAGYKFADQLIMINSIIIGLAFILMLIYAVFGKDSALIVQSGKNKKTVSLSEEAVSEVKNEETEISDEEKAVNTSDTQTVADDTKAETSDDFEK